MWASVKVRACDNEVAAEDEGLVSIAQDNLRRSTDFLRGILSPEWRSKGFSPSRALTVTVHMRTPCVGLLWPR